MDGKIIKVSSADSSTIISEWNIGEQADSITDIKIKSQTQQLYALTENSVYQIHLNQCEHYKVCTTCMSDPYCGWHMVKNVCQDTNSNVNNKNLISLNESMCARIQKQESVKTIQLDYGAHVELECNLPNDAYLFDFIEWRKDQQPIDFDAKTNHNLYLTWNKNILVLNTGNQTNGNMGASESIAFNCYVNKNELMSSYSLIYKQKSSSVVTSKNVQDMPGSSVNQSKCCFCKALYTAETPRLSQ